MALILSIETSEKICSVALSQNYELLNSLEISEEKSHAAKLTVLIDKLLKEKDIDIKILEAVAVSKGPGSYTGLRIGISVAKGICYALNIPLIAINTLQLLCWGLLYQGNLKKINLDIPDLILCPLIDARRMEVYRALYNLKGEQIGEIAAEVISESSFEKELLSHKIAFFGSGADKCRNIIKSKNAYFIEQIKPSASHMICTAHDNYIQNRFEDLAYFEPFYLKDFVGTVTKNATFLKK